MRTIAKVLFVVQLIPIAYYGSRRLSAFDEEIMNYFSDTETRSVTMTRRMMLVLCISAVISGIMGIIGREHFLVRTSQLFIPSLIFGSILFAVGYLGQKQPYCADDLATEEEPEEAEEGVQGGDAQARLFQDVAEVMETERLYLEADLRLTDLARRMGVSRSALSACINQEAGVSFSDYVNLFRVHHAQQLLAAEEADARRSVIQIAEESGFTSESSFYRAFRKATGMTPKQWLSSR